MVVDVLTLTIVLGLINLIQIIAFSFQYKANKSIKGLGYWVVWSSAAFVGFLLISLRKLPGMEPLSIMFQGPVLFIGTISLYIGVLRFFDKKVNYKFLGIMFVSYLVLHEIFYFISDQIVIRTLLFSAFLSFISFVTAYTLYKNKTESVLITANFNMAVFVLHGMFFGFRVILLLISEEPTDVFSSSAFNYMQFVDAVIVSLLWTFGLLMMVNQRLIHESTEAKTHFELIFHSIPDIAVISRIRDGLIIECNESFYRFSGYSKEEIAGKSSQDIHLWQNPEDRNELISQILKAGYCENMEKSFRRKDGATFIGLLSAKIISIKGIPYILTVTRDINERKKNEEEIRKINEELTLLNAEKDKFFSIIAHDLRSPFNGFIGLTQTMIEVLPTISYDKIGLMVERMRDSAINLHRLLDNLLEWSRMEQGLIPYNPEKLSLNTVIDEIILMSQETATQKEIEINHQIPDNIVIIADKNILQTVIRNLISNAIKFSPRGKKIFLAAQKNDQQEVEISVTDQGIGIPPELIEKLFRIDAKISRKGTENEASTGLGLILCKTFIEKSGGKISVISEKGVGSTFRFTLPLDGKAVQGLTDNPVTSHQL